MKKKHKIKLIKDAVSCFASWIVSVYIVFALTYACLCYIHWCVFKLGIDSFYFSLRLIVLFCLFITAGYIYKEIERIKAVEEDGNN